MSVATELLLYVEDGVQFQEKVESLIIDADILFKEVLNVSQIFSALETSNSKGVILVASQEMLGVVNRIIKSNPSYIDKMFVVHCLHNVSKNLFDNDNICEEVNMDKFNKFLNLSLREENEQVRSEPDLLYRLIRFELDGLGVSKKYIGYKYLVDIVYSVIVNEETDCYSFSLFEEVAKQNFCGPELIERDIRHMLTMTFNTNLKFQKQILSNSKNKTNINSKFILNNLINFIKNNI